jgi:hypothetical protein
MNIDEIFIGQLLVVRKLEEIADEISDNMRPWCGEIVKIAAIEKNDPDDDFVIIRLKECPDEEWYIEDFEKAAYPFYTPNEKNTANLTPHSLFKKSIKINPNKAFKDKKRGTSKKEWKVAEMNTITGRIVDKKVIEFNKEKKEYEYVKFDENAKFTILDGGVMISNVNPAEMNSEKYISCTFTAGEFAEIKKEE